MNILYYDCFAGISGDMHLGAMIDLGIDQEVLLNELKKLNLDGYSISIEKDLRKGISGTRVTVNLNHNHDHHHTHDHKKHHVHRNLNDIQEIVHKSDLSENIKKRAMKMFYLVAEAEAKIHNKKIEEIHFHEVGAVDSIVDTVGAAICIELLNVDKIYSSPVELGGGFIQIAHGKFPVPAPATAEILKDVPVTLGAVKKEMTTPTGAAILKANVDVFTKNPDFKVRKVAYGIGQRDTEIPNVLRVYLGTKETTNNDLDVSYPLISECNIDDMNPEWFTYISDKLFELGAMDVTYTPVYMKKGRPATQINVLHSKDLESKVADILFNESTTLGIRNYPVTKKELKREIKTVETPWGSVKIKLAYYKNKILKIKPEYEDCVRIAKNEHFSLNEVYQKILPYYNTTK